MNRLKMPAWSVAGALIILQMILVAIIVHGESLTFDECICPQELFRGIAGDDP